MQIDIQELEGRKHYVTPVVMLTVGVHHGSRGPILYPDAALHGSVPAWNGKPVVVYHPDMYSNGLAGHPRVFNERRVGWVFNTSFDGRRLLAQAWIDAERAKLVEPRILNSIQQRRVVEVSTGVLIDELEMPGVHNGRAYTIVVQRLHADHLAVLPDGVGACSIQSGCGLCRNEELLEPAFA